MNANELPHKMYYHWLRHYLVYFYCPEEMVPIFKSDYRAWHDTCNLPEGDIISDNYYKFLMDTFNSNIILWEKSLV